MQTRPVGSQEQWLAASKALLLKEKELTHLRDNQCRTFSFTLGQS
jgi:predicted dithiol-disulfide oxidoreductase (DUF899 family)